MGVYRFSPGCGCCGDDLPSSGNFLYLGCRDTDGVSNQGTKKIRISDGTVLWTADDAQYVDGGLTSRARAIVVDLEGNVYTAADDAQTSPSGVYGSAGVLIKRDPNGTLLWTLDDPVGDGTAMRLWSIAVDPSGNVVYVGRTDGGSNFVGKCDSDGTPLWLSAGANINSCDVDASGNVYTSPKSAKWTLLGGNPPIITKRDPDGVVLWNATTNDLGTAQDQSNMGVRVLANQSVHSWGTQFEPGSPDEWYTHAELFLPAGTFFSSDDGHHVSLGYGLPWNSAGIGTGGELYFVGPNAAGSELRATVDFSTQFTRADLAFPDAEDAGGISGDATTAVGGDNWFVEQIGSPPTIEKLSSIGATVASWSHSDVASIEAMAVFPRLGAFPP